MDTQPLLTGWHYASVPIKARGCAWYSLAHAACQTIAVDYAVSLETVAGITSALSPALSWDSNLTWTCRVLDHASTFTVRKPSLASDYNGYPASLTKAWAIAKATRTPPECFSPVTAPKTRAFFYNLLNPLDASHVTIDRHAASALLNLPRTRPIAIPWRKYNQFASLYTDAANQLSVLPNQLQATLWLLQRSGWQLSLF